MANRYTPLLKRILPGEVYGRIERARRDCSIVSFPKAGRTWHRAMIGHYLDPAYDPFQRQSHEMAHFYWLVRRHCGTRVFYTHNGTALADARAAGDDRFCDPVDWQDKKVLLLTRDVGDLVVSLYHQATHRLEINDKPLTEFIRAPQTGVEKILRAHHAWAELKGNTKDFLHIRYEDMQNDPGGALRQSLTFLGVGECSSTKVGRAVGATSFEKLQVREREARNEAGTQAGQSDAALKIRRGEVGSAAAELSPDDLTYIRDLETRIGNPFA